MGTVGNYLNLRSLGTTRTLVFSKTPRIHDRIDELAEHWDRQQRATPQDE